MIVSASRRTDLSAFYSAWLARRIEAGYADVANPFAPDRVRRLDLRPAPEGPLEVLALWTRRPGPLLDALREWEGRGLRTLWAVTITGYPGVLEPAAPPWATAVEEVRALSDVVGSRRIAWRYDPLLLCAEAGVDAGWHRRRFGELATALEGSVASCVLSLYDDYAKARRRLAAAGLTAEAGEELLPLVADLGAVARAHGIEPQSCCEELEASGIAPGACIDGDRIDELWGLGYAGRRDPGQRKGCRCTPSVDLGAYDTCLHGCLYCYATKGDELARSRFARHDAEGEKLV
ncbi:MAG: DUF1848 domain-containing protein [Deltaproteobacteria bacterium]|nr:DUF1848 domain-containing protein [Deltaproteobacteria bacterium]